MGDIIRKDPKITCVHQGEYMSMYELDYGNKIYEITSKTGSRKLNPDPLTLETLGNRHAGVVLFVFDPKHERILIGREFRLGVNQFVYNNIAGLIDAGETPEEAAKRELFEETGLTLTRVLKCLPGSFSSAPVTDDVVTCLICEAEGEIEDKSTEVEEIHAKWYTKKETLELLNGPIKFSGRMQGMAYLWACSDN